MLTKQSSGRTQGQNNGGTQITCKKIQNYIFNFSDLLGKGNFSKVYKAHNQITREIVAIKIVELNSLKSKKLQELLFSQIEILKNLKHPNVLKCNEVFTSNRNCYIITQLCNQGDLQSKLRTCKFMKESQAQPYVRDIFKGLTYLADNNIVHRDLKIANIFIHNGQAKIADFGFAKLTKSKFKDINIGSPIYMSPQGLIQNIYGPKTDIWAFGMLIFELLHGETPFSHCKSQNQLKYNMSIPIGWSQLKPELSNDIKQLILKCLQVDQNKRASASDLKKLAYFRQNLSLSPQKNHNRDVLGASYENKNKSSFSNEANTLPFKSDSNFYHETVKNRIRTENQIQPKKTTREISEMPSSRNYQRDSPAFTLKPMHPTSYMKLPQTQEKDRKLSNGKHSVSTSNFNASNNLSSHSYSKLIGQTPSKLQSTKSDAILSAQITFKQCVNILHYCRLLFKHIVLMRQMSFGDQNQSNIFKRWLSTILKTLMRQINQRKVICQGENIPARQKKLEQVTSEYIKKYTKQLNLDLSRVRLQESVIINYEKILNYFISIFQMIDQQVQKDANRPLLLLGHSIIVICDGTKTLKKCYEQRNYKRIDKFKQIEQFLTISKMHFDLPSYIWYKKKYPL